jgi:hypothetical protein
MMRCALSTSPHQNGQARGPPGGLFALGGGLIGVRRFTRSRAAAAAFWRGVSNAPEKPLQSMRADRPGCHRNPLTRRKSPTPAGPTNPTNTLRVRRQFVF